MSLSVIFLVLEGGDKIKRLLKLSPKPPQALSLKTDPVKKMLRHLSIGIVRFLFPFISLKSGWVGADREW